VSFGDDLIFGGAAKREKHLDRVGGCGCNIESIKNDNLSLNYLFTIIVETLELLIQVQIIPLQEFKLTHLH